MVEYFLRSLFPTSEIQIAFVVEQVGGRCDATRPDRDGRPLIGGPKPRVSIREDLLVGRLNLETLAEGSAQRGHRRSEHILCSEERQERFVFA